MLGLIQCLQAIGHQAQRYCQTFKGLPEHTHTAACQGPNYTLQFLDVTQVGQTAGTENRVQFYQFVNVM
jgi:hypothetical protein